MDAGSKDGGGRGDAGCRKDSEGGWVHGGRDGAASGAWGRSSSARAGGGGSFRGECGWHQLQFIATHDPATGRPAFLVNESVLSKVKNMQVGRGAWSCAVR